MPQIKINSSLSIRPSTWKKYTRVAVLTDENTYRFCYPVLKPLLPSHEVIIIPSGEDHKNLATCEHIWQALTELRFDRHAVLAILGGGVAGDMGGFCASTYKRGIDFLMIPTTLLSQVDAGIGGKLAIDLGPYKNQIGIFQQPAGIHISTGFLSTLPPRELRSGYAEVIKHCIIGDKSVWDKISKGSIDQQDWLSLVKHSVRFKTSVTDKDPREKGLRKSLNFGHTIGHALEGHFLMKGNRLFHGEAIAAGMILESYIANRKKLLKSRDLESITRYIIEIFGKVALPADDEWIQLIFHDKKNRGNKILMALPVKIGKAAWDIAVNEKEILEAVEFYRSA